MTAATEALQEPAPGPAEVKPSKSVDLVSNVVLSFGWWAFVAWLAGVALHRGFGVSLPFIPAFILAFLFATVTKSLAQVTGEAWHAERVKADTNLIAATMAVQQKASGDLTALLDSLNQ